MGRVWIVACRAVSPRGFTKMFVLTENTVNGGTGRAPKQAMNYMAMWYCGWCTEYSQVIYRKRGVRATWGVPVGAASMAV